MKRANLIGQFKGAPGIVDGRFDLAPMPDNSPVLKQPVHIALSETGHRGGIETIDPEEWDRLMAVNLRGLFLCCRAVLPTMRKQKSGKITTVASGTVFAGSPGRIHYVTSKAATIGFTRTLAREVGDAGINVNCLAPGNTLSEEHPTEQMIKFRESSVRLRALKRIQVPDDVVGAMLFLASPLSDFITGQTINVDGGISFL